MAPALRVPVSVNMAEFEQQMGALGRVTSQAVKTMRNEFIKLNAEIAVQGVKALGLFGAEMVKVAYRMGAFGAAFRGMARIAAPIALVVGTFEAMAAITEFARLKIEEFVKTQEKATAAGVSTDFFQRWVKGGEAIKLSLDDATAALERFGNVAKDKLGGSDLQKRIVELQEAGNLKGNTGVGAFESAIGNEDKLKATVSLIDQMLEKGERLAALDIAEKAFGPKVADNLRADAGYLDKMLASAKAIEATNIVNQADINRAVDLTNRLDAARRLLEEKWIPLQKQILKLGLDYNESWINLINNLATVVSAATSLLGIVDKIGTKLREVGAASVWEKAMRVAAVAAGPAGAPFAIMGGLVGGGGAPKDERSVAEQALASGLKNPAAIQEAKRQATEIQAALRGDASKPPGAAKAADEAEGAYDRQNKQIERHIELMKAEAASVGKGVEEQERARVSTLLTVAAKTQYKEVTTELAAEIEKEAEAAGKAKVALAKAQAQYAQLVQAYQTVGSAVSTAFSDAIVEGKKLNDVLKDLVKTLLKAAINTTIGNMFKAITPGMAFAEGTNSAPGGMALVGEKGPELVNLPRGSQVIPNDVLRGMGSSGSIVYSPAIDARGASVEAVARLAQIIEQDRAAFATRTVATIQQARRARVAGV